MRVGGGNVPGLAEANALKRVQHGLADMLSVSTGMTPVHGTNLLTYCEDRVKGGGGLLKNHCDVTPEHGTSLCGIQFRYIFAVNLNAGSPDTDSSRWK